MHVQRRAHLASKTIERLLALLAPWIERRWRGQLVKAARGSQELMTKAIVVEDSVQVGAKYAPVGADTSVQLVICQGGEGLCVLQIQSLADMNLVSGNEICLRSGWPKRESPWMVPEQRRVTFSACIVVRMGSRPSPGMQPCRSMPPGIGQLLAKHLHTAADTHHQTQPRVPLHRADRSLRAHPLQVAHGLFAAGQDHDIRVRQKLQAIGRRANRPTVRRAASRSR